MPNHCTNKVSIIGSRKDEFAAAVNALPPEYAANDVEKMLYKDDPPPKPELFSFNAIIPVPNHILQRGYSDAGHNWQSENWGTKWGAYSYGPMKRTKDALTYTFDTAWSPPRPVLAAASWRWGVVVALSFHEEYPSRGRYLFVGGKAVVSINDSDSPERGSTKWAMEYFKSHGAWVRELAKTRHVERADSVFKKASGGNTVGAWLEAL